MSLVTAVLGCSGKRPVELDSLPEGDAPTAHELEATIAADEYHAALVEAERILEDDDLHAYLQERADEIVAARGLEPGSIRVFVVKNPFMNAGVFPNGIVHLHTGILARIENEAEAVDPGRVDAVKVARELLVDLRSRLERADLAAELKTDVAPDAWCDRAALVHVLENLLTNAIRYTDAGGHIQVLIEPNAELLEVTVEDTGIGIPEASRDRIFERFYRVDAARSRAVGSTGLGLSIVRHLVQTMGGTIRVESEMGVGSRFVFTVPRAREADAGPS